MENTLSRVFNSYTPIRCSILNLLKPSEIMSLCMATKSILTDEEKKMHMNPLKEIFYSLEWFNELQSSGGKLVLLGSNVNRLCDPKCKQVKLLCLVHRNIPKPLITERSLLRDTYWTSGRSVYYDAEEIQDRMHIYDDVELRPMTYSYYHPYIGKCRVVLCFCIIDSIRSFILSYNAVLDVLVDADNIPILDFCKTKQELSIPYVAYIYRKRYFEVSEVLCTSSYTFNCRSCRIPLSKHVSISPSPWMYGMGHELPNISWRYWNESPGCTKHIIDKAEKNCIYQLNRT